MKIQLLDYSKSNSCPSGYILYKIKINSNEFLKSYADLSEPIRIPLSVMLTEEVANNSKPH